MAMGETRLGLAAGSLLAVTIGVAGLALLVVAAVLLGIVLGMRLFEMLIGA